MKIVLLRETKCPIDNRVVLTPRQVAELNKRFPSHEVLVQSSPIRVFTDDEYRAEGVRVVDDAKDGDILFGVKEVDIDSLIRGKQYFFFGHIAKMQEYNRPLLQAMMQKNITFCDYEYLVDDYGHRVCAFGWWAGVVGVYYTLRGYLLKHNIKDLPEVDKRCTLDNLLTMLKQIKLPKVKLLVTGTGRVSQGAQYVFEKIGARRLEEEAYFSNDIVEEFSYCIAGIDQLVKRKDGGEFSRQSFIHNADEYESDFIRWATQTDILICAHYWDSRAPVYLNEQDLRRDDMRIRMIGDITCDIKGSIKSTICSSTHDKPYYDYNPETEEMEPAFSLSKGITVMAVDTCPNALAMEASEYFGKMLMQYVFEPMLKNESSEIVRRSMILNEGILMPNFKYLTEFANVSPVS